MIFSFLSAEEQQCCRRVKSLTSLEPVKTGKLGVFGVLDLAPFPVGEKTMSFKPNNISEI